MDEWIIQMLQDGFTYEDIQEEMNEYNGMSQLEQDEVNNYD